MAKIDWKDSEITQLMIAKRNHLSIDTNGVTSYSLLADLYTRSYPNAEIGAYCLKTPFDKTTDGFIVLKFSIFDFPDVGVDTANTSQELIVSFFLASYADTILSLSANSIGSEIVENVSIIYDGTNWRLLFNSIADSKKFRHIVLLSANVSYNISEIDLTDGFEFTNVASISGWDSILKTVEINSSINVPNSLKLEGDSLAQLLSKTVRQRQHLSENAFGVTSYSLLADLFTRSYPDAEIGAYCLKTPFDKTTDGFIVLKFSIFDFPEVGVDTANTSQELIVSFFNAAYAGTILSLTANSIGSEIVENVSIIYDGTNWRLLFNSITDSKKFRHIVLLSANVSYNISEIDLTDGFEFTNVASISGWDSILKTIQITSSINVPNSLKLEGKTLLEVVEMAIGNSGTNIVATTKTLTIIGDSITDFCDSEFGGIQYVGYDQRILERIGFPTIINKGFSGYIVGVVSGFTSFQTQLAGLTLTDIYTIFLGTNDFWLSNTPLGTIDDYEDNTNLNTFFGGYSTIIDRIYELNESAKILLCTISKRNYSGGNSWDSVNSNGNTMADFNNAIKAIARYESLPIIDLDNECGFNKHNLSTVTVDNLHPNNIGYKMIGDVFIKSLSPII